MTIAVDFDGTIVTHAYPAIGRELPGAIEALKRLQSEGHRLILWTVREGCLLDEAVEYCRNRGLEFYAVNENYTGEVHTDCVSAKPACRKINADIYIDDRNVGGFPGWEAIYAMISHRMNYFRYITDISDVKSKSRKQGLLSRIFG